MEGRIRSYFLKGGSLLACVVVILVIKQLNSNNKITGKLKKREIVNAYYNIFNKTSLFYFSNSVDNTSNNLIEIGGIGYANESCLTTHLQVLPSYTGKACSQHPSACQSLTCLDVLTLKKKKQWESLTEKIKPEDVAYDDILYHDLSCPHFKKSRGFVLEPLSQESANFSIAFNILIHKSARQFEILLRSIYRPQNSFCIHVDGKASKNLTKAIENIISCFPNVFLASKMEKVIYAGYSRLQADITCMDDHLKRSSLFKYLINTAAQAFPIKTNEEMVKILKIYNGSNDIEGIYGKRLLKTRYMLYWTENTKNYQIQESKKIVQSSPPHSIDIVRGSAYGIFSRGFVEFIVNDQRAIDLLKWSQHTYSPDEFYWATLHHTYSNPHLHTPGGFSGELVDELFTGRSK